MHRLRALDVRRSRHRLRAVAMTAVAMLAAVLVLGGCVDGGVSGAGTAEPVPAATIAIRPGAGGAGTTVSVAGSGFPAGARVRVHLGIPNSGATPESYASAEADAGGDFAAAFVMPSTWPNGTPIAEPAIVIVAADAEAAITATASFDYRASPSTRG